jgi:hypothetical protein
MRDRASVATRLSPILFRQHLDSECDRLAEHVVTKIANLRSRGPVLGRSGR